jgi:large subunit ribosomal protein L25
MATTDLKVAPRTVLGKSVAKLRRAGITPANIYGHKIESTAVQVDTAELVHLMRHSSRNQIFNMTVEGEGAARTVVFRDVTRNPVNSQLLHVDFFQVSMTEKMTAQVQIVLVGTSDAVETFGGVLLQMIETIEVSALPGDLPSQVELDVSVLAQLEQSLHVRDLKLDTNKVTVNTDEDVVVARVASPRLSVEGEGEAAAEGAEGETPVGTETPAAAPGEGGDAE